MVTSSNVRSTEFATIEALFLRPLTVFPDPVHSAAEERFKAIGRTDDNRGVLIVFTLRPKQTGTLIRPISARYMHREELDYFEKAIAEATNR